MVMKTGMTIQEVITGTIMDLIIQDQSMGIIMEIKIKEIRMGTSMGS